MIRAESDEGYAINIPISFHGYRFRDIIGSGSTSAVILVIDENTGEKFTAKIIPKSYVRNKKLHNQIKTEISVLKEVDHPNIVKFHEHFEFTNEYHESYIAIIMEYCANGDLLSYLNLKRFKDEEQKHKIIRQFLDAIKYLHKKGIAHGDIKPENILLDSEYNAKLTDFGFAKTNEIAGDDEKNGTLFYAAPELFVRGKYNIFKTDIWSIGITLYCINQNNFPYIKGNQAFIVDQITSQSFHFAKNVPSLLKKVFERCTSNAEDRPSIEELMNDEFFCFNDKPADCFKNDIEQIYSKGENRYY